VGKFIGPVDSQLVAGCAMAKDVIKKVRNIFSKFFMCSDFF
jgi:hypothetical protein